MNTNSPIDQSIPTNPAQFEPPKPQSTPEEKLVAKAGMSSEWKHIVAFLESRKEHYRAFLPGEDGPKPVASSLSTKKLEDIGKHWVVSTTVIGEIEYFIKEIETITKSVREKLIVR